MRPDARGAVIFDCDGLLLDTEECWARATAVLFAEHGETFGAEERRHLLGAGPRRAGAALAGMLGLPDSEERLYRRLLALVREEVIAGARPLPGVTELLAELEGRLPLGVASNSPRALLEAAMGTAGLDGIFGAVVGVDEVSEGKPSPDVYLLACRRLGVSPRECIALEDSPVGVAAARSAGMHVVGVPSVLGVELDADLVADSLADPAVLAALLRRMPKVDEGRRTRPR